MGFWRHLVLARISLNWRPCGSFGGGVRREGGGRGGGERGGGMWVSFGGGGGGGERERTRLCAGVSRPPDRRGMDVTGSSRARAAGRGIACAGGAGGGASRGRGARGDQAGKKTERRGRRRASYLLLAALLAVVPDVLELLPAREDADGAAARGLRVCVGGGAIETRRRTRRRRGERASEGREEEREGDSGHPKAPRRTASADERARPGACRASTAIARAPLGSGEAGGDEGGGPRGSRPSSVSLSLSPPPSSLHKQRQSRRPARITQRRSQGSRRAHRMGGARAAFGGKGGARSRRLVRERRVWGGGVGGDRAQTHTHRRGARGAARHGHVLAEREGHLGRF